MKFFENIQSVMGATQEESANDKGTVVETVLLIASFVIVTLLVTNWIGTAIINTGANTAGCIEGANTYVNNQQVAQNCEKQKHQETNSFKKDPGYGKRFG